MPRKAVCVAIHPTAECIAMNMKKSEKRNKKKKIGSLIIRDFVRNLSLVD